MDADFEIQNEGSIYLFRPITDTAVQWTEDNLGDDTQWFHDQFVVEHRYAGDLIHQLIDDGFSVDPGNQPARLNKWAVKPEEN